MLSADRGWLGRTLTLNHLQPVNLSFHLPTTGAEEPFLVVVFVFAVSSLAGAASMLPGGIGAAEAGMAGMFAVAGLLGGLAVALSFVIWLTTLWFATLTAPPASSSCGV